MNPRVKKVTPTKNYELELIFTNEEKKQFDLKPYLDFGVFSELKEPSVFYSAKVEYGTVTWDNGADICPDTLYLESK